MYPVVNLGLLFTELQPGDLDVLPAAPAEAGYEGVSAWSTCPPGHRRRACAPSPHGIFC